MKRVLVAAALGGLLLVGTPTLASSAQRNDTRAEKGDNADKSDDKGKGGHKGDDNGGKGHRKDNDDRGDGRYRHGHRHGDYYDNYYGYPYYGGYYGDPYYGGGYGGARGGDVLIRGMAFNPPESRIRPGEDVTWVFSDRDPHTVTADNKSFDSGQRKDGEFRLRFDQPGTYSYHCAIHPEMKGRVLVG